jgi:hypothetical protein
MAQFRAVAAGFAVAMTVSSWAYAGQGTTSGQTGSTATQAGTAKPPEQGQKPPAKPEEKKPDEQITRKEDVVVVGVQDRAAARGRARDDVASSTKARWR